MSGRGNFRGRGGPGGGNRGGGGGDQGNRGDRQGGGGGGYRGRGDHRGGRGGGGGQDTRPPQRQEIYSPPGGLTPPSTEVQKAEDEMVAKNDKLSLSGLSLGAQPVMPLRPAYGTQGTAVVLRSNHFQIVVPDPKFHLYQYHVDVHPEPNALRKWKRIFQIFIKEADFLAEARPAVVTNNRSMLITTKKLPLENDRASSLILYYEEADLQAPVPDPSRPAQRIDRYQVKISLTNTLALDQLVESLKPAGADQPIDKDPFVQALNIAVQRKPGDTRGIATIPKSTKFFPLGAEGFLGNLGGGLVALGGYYTSVRTSTLRLLLNVNSVTSAFYQEGPLLDLMRTYRDSYKGPLDPNRALGKFLKGVRVRVSHLKSADGSEKVKTIFGLSTDPLGTTVNKIKFFWDKEGEMVTVQDYFRKQYNITLKLVNVPVVNVGNGKFPNYMPVELCYVLPGQIAKKKLSGEQTDAMVNCACRTPARNANLITSQGARALGLEQHVTDGPTLFGMQINPQMITVPGRILKSPMVYYGTSGKSTAAGTWNSIGAKFSVPRRADRWGYFRIRMPGNDHRWQEELEDIVGGEFYNALKNSGLNPDRPIRPGGFPDLTLSGRQADHLGQIDKYIAGHVMTTQARMLLIIIPFKSQALYANIKYLGDIKYGIHTVCALAKNMDKARGRSGYLVNIALKWNLKKGGTNQKINQSDVAVPLSKTMFMGIDVTHPGAGAEEGAPSIAGVVANINSELGQWPASIRIQKSRQEMVSDLDEMIVERLKVWVKYNKVLPESIIVYRDGVSEGQYATVLREEWPAFEKAMTKMYPKGPKPKISIIVVGKRHHTRFYPTREEDAIKNNPKNGTVVDRGVTSERYWDFFLQAHTALQGTCRPAHYVVLKDQNKLGVHGLENLTHNLCYTFGRCNRSVSICPPAYYADLVCDRARFYLFDTFAGSDNNDKDSESGESGFQASNARWRSGVHPNLAETMFYI